VTLRTRSAVVLLALVAALLPTAAAADPVFPGVTHDRLARRLADGRPVVAHVLTVAPGQGLEVVPVLADGEVPGLETVPSMGRRLLEEGYVAGVNGGFWLRQPVGDPNGLLAIDGALVSEAQTQGSLPRGTLGLQAGGRALLDRIATRLTLEGPGGDLVVTGVNRYPSSAPPVPDGDRPLLVYTAAFGPVALAPATPGGALRALLVQGLAPVAAGTATGTVQRVLDGPVEVEVPEGAALVVGHGATAEALGAVGDGDQLALRSAIVPETTDAGDWDGLAGGLAGGPLLVRDGRPTPQETWEAEGFAPEIHSLVRHPRTAVGVTADGRLLLVTVDGRQPGVSAGMTLPELAALLLDLGATDALSLDGGGSTAMAVDGQVRNTPCCDDPLRPVASGLFVRHAYDFTTADRLAGSGRRSTAAAIARAMATETATAATGGATTTLAGWAAESRTVVLAAAGDFPDALAGGPLAGVRGAPVLLTDGGELSAVAAEALDDLDPETVTVLGGPAAIGPAVTGALLARGHAVERIAGEDRVATAAAAARALGGTPSTAFLTGSGAWPDALTAAVPAGLLRGPVLLTDPAVLSAAARAVLRDLGVGEVVVVGGEEAVAPRVVRALEADGIAVTRVAGADRYATAAALVGWSRQRLDCAAVTPCLDPSGLVVARADRFPDALAGGPLAIARGHLLTIVPPGDVTAHPSAAALLAGMAPALRSVTLLGGHAALGSYQQWQLDQLAGGTGTPG